MPTTLKEKLYDFWKDKIPEQVIPRVTLRIYIDQEHLLITRHYFEEHAEEEEK
jgi:hypothetical protein